MIRKTSLRLTQEVSDNLQIIINFENSKRERLGIDTAISQQEVIENAIQHYASKYLNEKNGNVLEEEIGISVAKVLRGSFDTIIEAHNSNHFDIIFIKLLLRVLLNSLDDGNLSESEISKLLNTPSKFEPLIEKILYDEFKREDEVETNDETNYEENEYEDII